MPPVGQPMRASETERIERRAFLSATTLILAACAWFVLRPILAPVVLAMLTATIVYPLHRRIVQLLGGRRVLAASASTVLLTLVVMAPAFGLVTLFLVQVREVIAQLLGEEAQRSRLVAVAQQYLDWFSQATRSLTGDTLDFEALGHETLRRLGTSLYERIPALFGQAGRVAVGTLLLYVVLFTLLVRGPELVDRLANLLPIGRQRSRRILSRLEGTIKGVFLGSLATALVQGTVATIGFWLLGFENQLVWGVLIAATGIIPVVGTGLIWAPAALYLALTDQSGAALAMLAIGAVVSTVDNLIKPLLIHEQAEVHPALVFIGLFGGLATLGGMGLLYGPLLVACLTEMIRIYRDDFRPVHRVELGHQDEPPTAASTAADGAPPPPAAS